ncbi:hypothetical protein [Hydrogenimonas sp.]
MKIAIRCKSILLEKSLYKFLKETPPVSEEEADILIVDHAVSTEKPTLRIGMGKEADLKKPFSRSQLMIKLEEKMKKFENHTMVRHMTEEDEESLEEKIEKVTRIFVDELITIVRGHYEKKKRV